MKTYNKTTEKNRLEIRNEDCPESPRAWSNLGKFITSTRGYKSPDKDFELETILEDSKELSFSNADEHARYLQGRVKKAGKKIRWFCMVSKYDHSGVTYSIGAKSGWDVGVAGFYLVEVNDETKTYTDERIAGLVAGELETYTKYCNGDVYGFVLYDEAGEVVDSCGGFYDIEDIKDYLPEEWKDEELNKYII